jgi:hypothetical protein
MVRDMKNPGDKIGNDVTCEIPPEAIAIMSSMPETTEKIFPDSAGAISEPSLATFRRKISDFWVVADEVRKARAAGLAAGVI